MAAISWMARDPSTDFQITAPVSLSSADSLSTAMKTLSLNLRVRACSGLRGTESGPRSDLYSILRIFHPTALDKNYHGRAVTYYMRHGGRVDRARHYRQNHECE